MQPDPTNLTQARKWLRYARNVLMLSAMIFAIGSQAQSRRESAPMVAPMYLCIEERSAFMGGHQPTRKVLYVDSSGYTQKYVISNRQVLSFEEHRQEPFAGDIVKTAIEALGDGGEDSSYAAFRESLTGQWHPATVGIVARTGSGRIVRWLGTKEALPQAVATLCSEFGEALSVDGEGHAVQVIYLRATVLSDAAVRRFERDDMFNHIESATPMQRRFISAAIENPYRLTRVPQGVNPFAPFHPNFEPGNIIEVKHAGVGFQIESFSGKTDREDNRK